jgi:transmembrane sensor
VFSTLGYTNTKIYPMFNDYTNYDIEDFAFDESFQQWVFDENSEHSAFWEKYIAEHPRQTDKILSARSMVQQLKVDESLNEPHVDLMRVIWSNVQKRTEHKRVVFWKRLSRWHVAASTLLVLAGFMGWYWLSPTYITGNTLPKAFAAKTKNDLIEEVNRTNNVIKIYLEDGSVVSLAKNSRLTYPKKFGSKERVVQLKGEAFFDVAKNPEHPFLIYANETITKVLGTSFRIRAFQNDPKVIVSVTTGKVSVFVQKDVEQNLAPRGVVLTANQEAEFSRSHEQFNKTLVESPVILTSEKDIQFEFNDTPLNQVFDALQRAYGVEIIYDPELVKGRSLKVSLDDESLYEKLNVICNTVGMSYQMVDAKVIIENKK